MAVPTNPKIYHIVHVDRLPSIIADGFLWCDAEIVRRSPPGTTIGMNDIKQRRLTELCLNSHPNLMVGACVPFYFCPRSIMLYLLHRGNHEGLSYRDGQEPIIHLEADLRATVAWATNNKLRWAFTLSNAGARYFEDRCDFVHLDEIDWDAVQANKWSGAGVSRSVKEGKQAEFLTETAFPFHLVSRVGVKSRQVYDQVRVALRAADHQPAVEMLPAWYY
jgi:hypothetical protein